MFQNTLLVEDNAGVATALRLGFRDAGVKMEHVSDLASARVALGKGSPDLLLVDLMLPDGNGIELVRWARDQQPPVPVVIMTGLGDEEHVVRGLEEGADLYIKKPFTARELLAHLEALSRRIEGTRLRVDFSGLSIDLLDREAAFGSKTVRLTDVEARLLATIVEASGALVLREDLLLKVWNLSFDPGTGLLHSHVRNLRRKLARLGMDDWIQAVRSQGYLIKAPSVQ